MYELDEETCTHGPDTAPAGLAVSRDVPPVTVKAPEPEEPRREAATVPPDAEIVRDQGGSSLSPGAPALIPDAAPGEADFIMGAHDVACEGDGRTGKRVQVLYLHEFGTPSRFTGFVGSIRTWSAGVDQIFDASAAETGGSRHIRFVTTPQCRVDVAEVQLPEGALESFTGNIAALQTLGYNRTDRKYLIFADTNVYCGIGTFIADSRPGLGNRNNGGPSYGRVDSGCWSSAVAAQQTTQMLGALLQDSPNSTGAEQLHRRPRPALLRRPLGHRAAHGLPEEAREPPRLRSRRLLQHRPGAGQLPGEELERRAERVPAGRRRRRRGAGRTEPAGREALRDTAGHPAHRADAGAGRARAGRERRRRVRRRRRRPAARRTGGSGARPAGADDGRARRGGHRAATGGRRHGPGRRAGAGLPRGT
nr:hypothetical protein GCM10020092_028440 [Actinoplanes digitatis]